MYWMDEEFGRRLSSFLTGDKWWDLVQELRKELGDAIVPTFIEIGNALSGYDSEFNKKYLNWSVSRKDIDGALGNVAYAVYSTWNYAGANNVLTEISGTVQVHTKLPSDCETAKKKATAFALAMVPKGQVLSIDCRQTDLSNATVFEVTGTLQV